MMQLISAKMAVGMTGARVICFDSMLHHQTAVLRQLISVEKRDSFINLDIK